MYWGKGVGGRSDAYRLVQTFEAYGGHFII